MRVSETKAYSPTSLLFVVAAASLGLFLAAGWPFYHDKRMRTLAFWSVAQWIPIKPVRTSMQRRAWDSWERHEDALTAESSQQQEIPVIHVQEHRHDLLLPFLEQTYGSDWRKRPLLLKGLWSREALQDNSRRLSLTGLLQENITIPYFTDARLELALTPDATAPVKNIVANISAGRPHKIGTQLVVQAHPELIREVAPVDIVTDLFGDYFTPDAVRGSGPGGILPALTTVPLFVASSGSKQGSGVNAARQKKAHTGLHCEPIGNVAVQLSGKKQWTLVLPEYSRLLRPSLSPDGRAFFASWRPWSEEESPVPRYTAVTEAGDAMWVPTWTWHRVDYVESPDVAIGGSLFHFRFTDYLRNNPVYAILLIPAILLELLGISTQ